MRYRLRTLLIVLALGPPVLAACWWSRGIALGLLGAFVVIAPLLGLVGVARFFLERQR